jgi:cysteine desulfurase
LNNISQIYLDNNSTTQVDQRIIDEMLPYLTTNYFNSNSSHFFGNRVKNSIIDTRDKISEILNADSSEIIFTSGATESINIALKAFVNNNNIKGKHIITVKTEHSAVLESCKYLESIGFEVTYLNVLEDCIISIDNLRISIRPDTFLIAVMYVNNETGVIQPIKEISKIAHESGILFMCDTTQAIGKIQIDVKDLNIDILCISGHKIYAPKGIGALYMSKRVLKLNPNPLLHGGKQEFGLRSGTINVPGIIALGKACLIAQSELTQNRNHIEKLRNQLENNLLKIHPSKVNGSKEKRIFNVCNICFEGIDSNILIGKLKNIAISNGSACNSLIVQPSHVLIAMGLSENEAMNSVRFSLGKFNNESEINETIEIFKQTLTTYA